MENQIFHIALALLSKNNIGFKSDVLKKQLLSHPDFPSLAAFSDTLTYLGIENLVCQIRPSDLSLINKPFLAVIQNDGSEQLVLIESQGNEKLKVFDGLGKKDWAKEDFLKFWQGIILAIETEGTNKSSFKKNVSKNILIYLLPIALIGFSFFWFSVFSLSFWHCILSMAGIWVVIALWQAEQGNAAVAMFCNLSVNTSCHTVLASSAGKLFGKVPLTLIACIYFSWQTISWLLWKDAGYFWIPFIHILVLPVTIYTLWQQAFVIKKWCPLCLALTGILWLQAVISIFHFFFYPQELLFNIEISQLLIHTCLVILITIGAFQIQNAFGTDTQRERLFIENLAFRRNYHLFLPWYKVQEPIPDTLNKVHKGIHANGEMSTIQLIVITNPLCEACQRIHHVWEQLLKKYPEEISIEWRFCVPADHLNDPRTMISAWLLKQWIDDAERGLAAFHEWFHKPNLQHFDKLRISKKELELTQPHLKAQFDWCKKNNLTQTPLLLVNGKRFPNWYMEEDIRYFIENLLESDESSLNIIRTERMNYHGVMLADT